MSEVMTSLTFVGAPITVQSSIQYPNQILGSRGAFGCSAILFSNLEFEKSSSLAILDTYQSIHYADFSPTENLHGILTTV